MVDILAFGAHPDDIEFGVGGILLKAVSQGQTVALVDLTAGEMGSHGNPEIRLKEALEAARTLGAERYNLGFSDCQVVDTYEGRLKLTEMIRKFKPKLVLAPLWDGSCNHPDHLACGVMARHACRYARFPKVLPDLAPHRPAGILHYLPPLVREADFLVDISPFCAEWKQLIQCHASQLKTMAYDERCLKHAAYLGNLIGVEYAQGLVKGNPIAVDDLLSVAQGSVEL